MPTKEPDTKTRAIGAALGSGVSNFATGYALSPFVYDQAKHIRRPGTSWFSHYYGKKALKPAIALSAGALVGGAIKEHVQAMYERRQKAAHSSAHACGKCGRVSGDMRGRLCGQCAFPNGVKVGEDFVRGFRDGERDPDVLVRLAAGGASTIPPLDRLHPEKCVPIARQALISAGIIDKEAALIGESLERRRSNPWLPMPFRGDLDGLPRFDVSADPARWKGAMEQQVVLLMYRRHPGELGKEPARKEMKGPAKILGHRLNPREVMRKGHRDSEDSWMREHAEALDLGTKPGLAAMLQDVCGMKEGVVVARADLLKMLREKDGVRDESVTRRRFAKIKGRPEQGADSRHDAGNFLKDLEVLLENPDVRYVELARK